MEDTADITASPVDGLIDLEIELIREGSGEQTVHKTDGAWNEIHDKAESLFAPYMWDPVKEKSKVEDIVSFAVNECGCDSPLALVNLLNQLKSRQGPEYGQYDFMDGIWRQVNLIRATRAMRAV